MYYFFYHYSTALPGTGIINNCIKSEEMHFICYVIIAQCIAVQKAP